MKEIKNMHQFDELKLSQSFQEACQDKEFKEYVDKTTEETFERMLHNIKSK